MNNNYPPTADIAENENSSDKQRSLIDRIKNSEAGKKILKKVLAVGFAAAIIVGGAMASTTEAYAAETDNTPTATQTSEETAQAGDRDLTDTEQAADTTEDVQESTEQENAEAERLADNPAAAQAGEQDGGHATTDAQDNEKIGKEKEQPGDPDTNTPSTPPTTGEREALQTGATDVLLPAGIAAVGLSAVAGGVLAAKRRRSQANNRQNVAPGSRRNK